MAPRASTKSGPPSKGASSSKHTSSSKKAKPTFVSGPKQWLGDKPLPPRWKEYCNRSVVMERQYLTSNILANSSSAKVQIPDILEFLNSKHYTHYISRDFVGFADLTRLFYASLEIVGNDHLKGRIGDLQFRISRNDVVRAFDTDTRFVSSTTVYSSEPFQDAIPSPSALIEELFIMPNRKPFELLSYTDIYVHIFMMTNITLFAGNKELTHYLMEKLWIMKHHTPCLGHLIFDHMRFVLDSNRELSLPFPDLIRRLLIKEGLKIPRENEQPLKLVPYDANHWERLPKPTRCRAFLARNWKLTEGLVVGGVQLPDDHELYTTLGDTKRKAVEVSTDDGEGPSSRPVTDDVSLSALAQLISNMNVSMNTQFASIGAQFNKVNTKLEEVTTWMKGIDVWTGNVDSVMGGMKSQLDGISASISTGQPSTFMDDVHDVDGTGDIADDDVMDDDGVDASAFVNEDLAES